MNERINVSPSVRPESKPATREELLLARTAAVAEITKLRDLMVGEAVDGPEAELAIMKITRLQAKLNIIDRQLEKSNADMFTEANGSSSEPETIPMKIHNWDGTETGGTPKRQDFNRN